MRMLAAASGGEGHLGPLLPFVRAARDAGDDVLLVVPPALEDTARSTGCAVHVTDAPDAAEVRRVRQTMASGDRATRVHAAEVELFGRLNTMAALPAMEAAVASFRPDLILREPCDYASAVVATRQGIRTAQVGISPGTADVSGLRLAAEVVEPLAPGLLAAVESAPYLTRFPVAEDTGFADTRRYGFPGARRGVGGAVESRRASGAPLVWLTMGTVNSSFDESRGTWDAILAAVADLPVRAVASTGRGGPPLAAPPNVEVVEWVELADILGRADAVVCHGGSGTTLAALAAGLPLVVVPLIADQPANGALVESLGAGIVVAPAASERIRGLTAADVPRLRQAIARVVEDVRYREAAGRVARLSQGLPTAREAMDALRP